MKIHIKDIKDIYKYIFSIMFLQVTQNIHFCGPPDHKNIGFSEDDWYMAYVQASSIPPNLKER